MADETKRTLLAQATAEFGVSPLARKLRVPDGVLATWLAGQADMPDRKLLVLAALLQRIKNERK
jgi:hypothetical protein